MSVSDGPAPLEAARKLAPQIRASADEIDANRELTRPVFEALADAGMFHLAVPRAIGGGEIDLPTYIQVIEELGKADASTGWIVNQGAGLSREPSVNVHPRRLSCEIVTRIALVLAHRNACCISLEPWQIH